MINSKPASTVIKGSLESNRDILSLVARIRSYVPDLINTFHESLGSSLVISSKLSGMITDLKLPLSLLDTILLNLKGESDNASPILHYACESSLTLTRSVLDTVYVTIGRVPKYVSTLRFFQRYVLYYLKDEAEEHFKYHTGYLTASLCPGTQLPKKSPCILDTEVPGVIFGGIVRRYFNSSKLTLKKKFQLAMSLQNAKRGAVMISSAKQNQFIEDHRSNMKGMAYEGHGLETELEQIKDKLERLCDVIYPKNFKDEIPGWRAPSIKSCYEKSAKDFGASSTIDESMYSFETKYGSINLDDERINGGFHCADLDIGKEVIPLFCPTSFEDVFSDEISEVFASTCLRAKVAKINEAFKTRVATCGPAHVYNAARRIQKPLWSYLQKPIEESGLPYKGAKRLFRHSTLSDKIEFEKYMSSKYRGVSFNPFIFTGKPATEDDVSQHYLGSLVGIGEYFEFIVAGDYKAATDGMHPMLPMAFCNKMRERFGEYYYRVAVLTLKGHILDYGKGYQLLEQTWGQLMGSPLSFPVLCLVNASLFWASVEKYEGRSVPFSYVVNTYKLLINGDDISFLSNSDHYAIWSVYAKAAGMSPSPGKCYISSEFININSTTFWVEKENNVITSCKQLFVCNSGLLKGQGKVLTDETIAKSDIGVDNQLVNAKAQLDCLYNPGNITSCDDPNIRSRIQEVFMCHMEDKIAISPRFPNLPVLMGGMGFGGPLTDEERKFASYLIKKGKVITPNKDLKSERFNRRGVDYLRQILGNNTSLKEVSGFWTTEKLVERCEAPDLSKLFIGLRGCESERDTLNRMYADERFRSPKALIDKYKRCSRNIEIETDELIMKSCWQNPSLNNEVRMLGFEDYVFESFKRVFDNIHDYAALGKLKGKILPITVLPVCSMI